MRNLEPIEHKTFTRSGEDLVSTSTVRTLFVAIAVAAGTLGPGASAAQTGTEAEEQIRSLMVRGEIPGLSIATVASGSLAWHGAFGVKNAESGEPVTERTVFEAASLSKPMFAYAVLRLAGTRWNTIGWPTTSALG